MPRHRPLLALLLLLAPAGCGTSTDTTTILTVPTAITVDPSAFVGPAGCGPGAVQSYIAELTRIDMEDDGGFVPPPPDAPVLRSPAVSCGARVSFGTSPQGTDDSSYIVSGQRYVARILAYRASAAEVESERGDGGEPAPDWTTCCGQICAPVKASSSASDGGDAGVPIDADLDGGTGAETDLDGDSTADAGFDGSAAMDAGLDANPQVDEGLDEGATADSAPDASATANFMFAPTLAVASEEVFMTGCFPLQPNPAAPPPAGATSIAIDLGAACASAASAPTGQMTSFKVIPEAAGLAVKTATCAAPLVTYDEGLMAGESYGFDIEAYQDEAQEPMTGARCTSVAVSARTTSAACTPLATAGGIIVELPASATARCTTAAPDSGAATPLATYIVTLRPSSDAAATTPGVAMPPAACSAATFLGPLAPGAYDLVLHITAGSETSAVDAGMDAGLLPVSCSALVLPGRTARAVCASGGD